MALCRALFPNQHGKHFAVCLPRPTRHNAVRSWSTIYTLFAVILPCISRHTFNLCRVPCVKCTRHICALCRDPSQAHHGKPSVVAVCSTRRSTANLQSLLCALPELARLIFRLCRVPVPTPHGKTPLPSTFASPLCLAPPPTPHGKLTIWSSASCQVLQVGAKCGLCRAQLHGTGLCRVPCHGKVTIWHRFLLFLQKSLHFTEKAQNNSQMIILTQI